MQKFEHVDDNTPILIGSGQLVQREATVDSPMQLAAMASEQAIRDSCGNNVGKNVGKNVAAQIDTICVTKLFSDMSHLWPCKWGRSNNPPQSVARRIGAQPNSSIYTQTGGNQPQSRLLEFAVDIARGERSLVLLTGAEALKNQRHAERAGTELDWNEHFDEALEDRGFGDHVATSQEMKGGLNNVIYYYALIEQAQRNTLGRDVDQHRAAMAQLMASFSAIAANNPHAQFAGQQSAQDILAAPDLSHLYTKRMIAQDGVNQAAALLLCSVGKARELGIDESKWVFMHGMAEGTELELSCRDNPGESPMAAQVAQRTLDMAQMGIEAIDLIDIYSCFPCAVTAVAQSLNLPTDGSYPLTITGGLPYFGGPGNNYGMHALAEMVQRTRNQPEVFAMITSNGGVLSKHATGIYSHRASAIDWTSQTATVSNESFKRRAIAADPGLGRIVSYTVNHEANGHAHAFVLGETESGDRFVARTAPEDKQTAAAMLLNDPSGKSVTVSKPIDERLHFQLTQ